MKPNLNTKSQRQTTNSLQTDDSEDFDKYQTKKSPYVTSLFLFSYRFQRSLKI